MLYTKFDDNSSAAFAALLSKLPKDRLEGRKIWLLDPHGIVLNSTHTDWKDPFEVDPIKEKDSLLAKRARALTQALVLKRNIAPLNQILTKNYEHQKSGNPVISPITHWFNEQLVNEPGIVKSKRQFLKRLLRLNEEDLKVFYSSNSTIFRRLLDTASIEPVQKQGKTITMEFDKVKGAQN